MSPEQFNSTTNIRSAFSHSDLLQYEKLTSKYYCAGITKKSGLADVKFNTEKCRHNDVQSVHHNNIIILLSRFVTDDSISIRNDGSRGNNNFIQVIVCKMNQFIIGVYITYTVL